MNLRWIVVSAPTGRTSPDESGGVDPGAAPVRRAQDPVRWLLDQDPVVGEHVRGVRCCGRLTHRACGR